MYGFAVGSSGGNTETELIKFSNWSWESRSRYPYASSYISYHAAVSKGGDFYVIAGEADESYTATIARYNTNTDTWTRLGDLVNARRYHDAIWSQDFLIVVGGTSATMSERCSLNGDSVVCVEQSPSVGYG